MGRQSVDATLGALARRRTDLSSAHFGLGYQMIEPAPDTGQAPVRAQRIGISAPKRQLKRAVDRNALKRVAREAWRLAGWPPAGRPQVILLRLRRAEADWKTMGRAALKKAWRAEIDELLGRLIRRLASQGAQAAAPQGAEVAASLQTQGQAGVVAPVADPAVTPAPDAR